MQPQIDRKQVGCTPKSAQHGSDAPPSGLKHGRIRPSRAEFGSDPALDGSIFNLHCKTRVILHGTRAWKSSQTIANHLKPSQTIAVQFQTLPIYESIVLVLLDNPSVALIHCICTSKSAQIVSGRLQFGDICTSKSVQNGSNASPSRPRHGRIRPSRAEFGSDPALDGSIFKLHCIF